MYKYFLLIALILCSFSVSAQWQQTGSKVRYVTGIGIPTKDTAAGVLADSSQILIRPADSSLYVKYKRTWLRVGGGGGSISGGGSFNYIPKFTSSSSIGNSLIYDDGSLIGIGTATPNTFLDVRGSATFKATSPRIFIDDNDNNGTASIWFRPQNASFNIRGAIDLISAGSGAAGEFRFSAGSTGGTGNAAHYMSFYTAALERMRIDSAGNVGIGTTSPWEALSIPFNSKLSFGSSTYPLSISRSNAANFITTISDNYDVSNTRIDFVMRNGTANQNTPLSLLSSGNVGIGTTSPIEKLHLVGNTLRQNDASNSFGYTISTTSATTTLATLFGGSSFGIRTGGSGSDNMRIDASGNVGIGTTSPAAKLSVQGTTLINTNTDNGTDKLQVNGSMNVSTLATTNNLSVTTNATVGGTATIQGNTQINGLIGVNTTPSSYALTLRQSGTNIVQFGTQSTSNINTFYHSSSTIFGQIGNAAGALSGGSNNDMAVGAVGASNNLVLFSNSVERMRVTASGRLLANTTTDNTVDQIQVNGSVLSTQYKLSALNTAPASATAAGTTGEIRIDANYIYICTATNTWKRVAIATW